MKGDRPCSGSHTVPATVERAPSMWWSAKLSLSVFDPGRGVCARCGKRVALRLNGTTFKHDRVIGVEPEWISWRAEEVDA